MAFKKVALQADLIGFYKPEEKGDQVTGILRKVVATKGKFGPGTMGIFELTEPGVFVTQGKPDKKGNKELVEVDCKAGDCVGVSISAGLQGIERFINETLRITMTGEKTTKGGTMKTFDIEVAEREKTDKDSPTTIPF